MNIPTELDMLKKEIDAWVVYIVTDDPEARASPRHIKDLVDKIEVQIENAIPKKERH